MFNFEKKKEKKKSRKKEVKKIQVENHFQTPQLKIQIFFYKIWFLISRIFTYNILFWGF
jgi:hypothetical protein